MKKILPALITGLLLSSATHADENPVTAEKLSDSVYVLFGQGGNIAASVGEDGIYIIDDQFAKLSQKWEDFEKKLIKQQGFRDQNVCFSGNGDRKKL